MARGLGDIQKKALLLLSAGLGLSFSRSGKDHLRVIRGTVKEWKKINQHSLRKAIKGLYVSKLVGWREKPDGVVELVITDRGKKKILAYDPDYLKISIPKKWDKKWRIVIFDIPEKQRGARDSLRSYLKKLDFYELQKSVFVQPYPCDDIFDFLVEFHNIRKYVRFILADDLDNSLHLKNIFNLS
ncbi:MAG: CRISPR-associated endonuclease Cas2 [bacterium]|nr:CRISPR-associated endonuclease Cas2 [bacterium]